MIPPRPAILAVLAWLLAWPLLSAQTAPVGQPRRIVSVIPAVTEMLFAVGAGPKVIAVSSFDHYPPEVEKLPKVGALIDPDLERILALRPDLVIVYGTQTDLRAQLDRASVPTFIYKHGGLADVIATMKSVGSRVGHAGEADRAARQIEEKIASVRSRVSGRAKPRTLVVFSREPLALRGIYASGAQGFINDMVTAAGGANVFADIARESVQATSELILTRRPDVILELSGAPLGADELVRERAVWSVLASVPAVRSGRVFILADERTVTPGPRIADGIEAIARVLHPEAFR
jgi:iron complex transport system substrate-binding protein